jgi:hypothetical protein
VIFNAYLVGQLIGAVIAVGALSRLLFACTKSWPYSSWKLLFINILSGVLSISWAIIGYAVSAGGVLGQAGRLFIVYGSAQCLVLAVDLLRYRSRIQNSVRTQTRVEPRF